MRHARSGGLLLLLAGFLTGCSEKAGATDNTITPEESKEGWILLFDGKTPAGWMSAGQPMDASLIESGILLPLGAADVGGVYTRDRYSNFQLALDFCISKGCDSGIFLRINDPKDIAQTAIEMQVGDGDRSSKPSRWDCGAIFDVLRPAKHAMKGVGKWNHVEIQAENSAIRITMNGASIIDMNLDQWKEAGKNPDGTTNKFKKPYKDMPREGHIGLQGHVGQVWYKNIKIKPLNPAGGR